MIVPFSIFVVIHQFTNQINAPRVYEESRFAVTSFGKAAPPTLENTQRIYGCKQKRA
jgi:hypothetical protein